MKMPPTLCGRSSITTVTAAAEDSSHILVHHTPSKKQPPPISISHLLRFSLIQCCSTTSTTAATAPAPAAPTTTGSSSDATADDRPSISGTTVTGTFYGHRRGHVSLCLQQDRLATTPPLLLDLAIPTKLLAKEMHSGIVRIALETDRRRDGPQSETGADPPLHSVPVWTTFCNGRRLGYAVKRRVSEKDRLILKTVQSTSVGAGVIPSEDGEVMYMRAGFRRVVGSADSESYHLINPDGTGGQELSVFLLRTG
ncbi:unnamed protein product [Victoria cruziana]